MLADRGDGTLMRFGPVWSWPTAPRDNYSNTRAPFEAVSDVLVQSALKAGAWIATMNDADGKAMIVEPAADVVKHPLAFHHAGTAAARTEG